jgi:hypothetical protein
MAMVLLNQLILCILLCLCVNISYAFTTTPSGLNSIAITKKQTLYTSISSIPKDVEWKPLIEASSNTDLPPVIIHTLEEGSGDIPSTGATVEIEYKGTLLENEWSANDVVECWLSQQQGIDDHLKDLFIEKDIDFKKLTDENTFNDDFCIKELGITNKIQGKKLVMAAKRLRTQSKEFPPNIVFDSSASRNKNYSFVLGSGKAIKAIDVGVSSMKVGEKARIICRSDYGYGAEGLRSPKGDVIVPPFATLCFELTLISAIDDA